MKRNLQEGRRARKTQIIYEGNGFAKVMKGGKLIERVQLEKGDNLLESLKALTEGAKFVKEKPSYQNDYAYGSYEFEDGSALSLADANEEEGTLPTLFFYYGESGEGWTAVYNSKNDMETDAAKLSKLDPEEVLESGKNLTKAIDFFEM